MQTYISTTPFGRRSLTLGMMSSQVAAKAMPADASAHKWHVFQDIKEARIMVGATDRALAILNALLSFHPDTALHGDGELIVWPSNEQLIDRANGMSPATLRRHLVNLVDCGLIIRRDSPNGKRFARKGQGGEIEQAYGFDLSPIVARAAEFKDLADAVKAEKKAYRLVKERLTICRRDIVKMIDTGIEEGVPANWGRVQQTYQAIVSQIPRTAPRQTLEAIADELEELWAEVRQALESFINSQNMNANESQNEPQQSDSNPDSHFEFEPAFEKARATGEPKTRPYEAPKTYQLGLVLKACPDIADYAAAGIANWRDLMVTAAQVKGYLGVSPSAYEDACHVMGPETAAIVVACILQRAQHINSAGGYLRALTDKARAGQFSVGPMLMAALKANASPLERRAG